MNGLSVLIPLYNEADTVLDVLHDLNHRLSNQPEPFELILVNDGSTDLADLEFPKWPSLIVVTHCQNKGYGSSLKSALARARYNTVAFFDADGQHKAQDLDKLLESHQPGHMTLGVRNPNAPGRKLCRRGLTLWSSWIAGKQLTDPCTGLRLLDKTLFETFLPILPNRYSLSTTITLCAVRNGFSISEIPVAGHPRPEKRNFFPSLHAWIIPFRLFWNFALTRKDKKLLRRLSSPPPLPLTEAA